MKYNISLSMYYTGKEVSEEADKPRAITACTAETHLLVHMIGRVFTFLSLLRFKCTIQSLKTRKQNKEEMTIYNITYKYF